MHNSQSLVFTSVTPHKKRISELNCFYFLYSTHNSIQFTELKHIPTLCHNLINYQKIYKRIQTKPIQSAKLYLVTTF